MTITDVENMSAADLKARRDEILAGIADAPDLAARYLQARTDATMRDEKLGEQGRTITLLQSSVEKFIKDAEADQQTLAKFEADIVQLQQQLVTQTNAADEKFTAFVGAAAKETSGLQLAIGQLQDALSVQTGLKDAAVALAKGRRVALADIQTLIAPLLAAE